MELAYHPARFAGKRALSYVLRSAALWFFGPLILLSSLLGGSGYMLYNTPRYHTSGFILLSILPGLLFTSLWWGTWWLFMAPVVLLGAGLVEAGLVAGKYLQLWGYTGKLGARSRGLLERTRGVYREAARTGESVVSGAAEIAREVKNTAVSGAKSVKDSAVSGAEKLRQGAAAGARSTYDVAVQPGWESRSYRDVDRQDQWNRPSFQYQQPQPQQPIENLVTSYVPPPEFSTKTFDLGGNLDQGVGVGSDLGISADQSYTVPVQDTNPKPVVLGVEQSDVGIPFSNVTSDVTGLKNDMPASHSMKSTRNE
jgi:hypothetical protein